MIDVHICRWRLTSATPEFFFFSCTARIVIAKLAFKVEFAEMQLGFCGEKNIKHQRRDGLRCQDTGKFLGTIYQAKIVKKNQQQKFQL